MLEGSRCRVKSMSFILLDFHYISIHSAQLSIVVIIYFFPVR